MFNLRTYLAHHAHALSQSFQNAVRTPIATFLTVAVLSIALLLPTLLFTVLNTVTPLVKNLDTGSAMAVYLKLNTSDQEAAQLVDTLKKNADFTQVTFISAAQGLQDFSKAAGLASAFAALKTNPLPSVIQLQPVQTDPTNIERLQKQLSGLANVDLVQFDSQWVKRLFAIMDLIKQFIYGLGVILSVAVLLIIGNTIRSLVQSHQAEIVVLKLLGASTRFISRPFMYAGLLYGFVAGLMTLLLALLFMHWLQIPADTLATLYNTHIQLQGLTFKGSIILLFGGMLLGILGAWLALAQHVLDVEI